MRLFLSLLKKYSLIIAGTLSLTIGIIGIVIPVLPTTPFLLLAALCYLRGSNRLYTALLSSKFLGSYIRNYLEGRGMSRVMKIWTLCLLWIAIILSALLVTDNTVVRLLLGAVLLGVTIHILMIKTIKEKR
jgi:uncharacterized membrane protein YbaN (DUF454 family)